MLPIRLRTSERFVETRADCRILLRTLTEIALKVRNALDVTAIKNHVVTGHERALGQLLVRAEVGDGVHFHVVADGDATEPDGTAKKIRRHTTAERCRKVGFI